MGAVTAVRRDRGSGAKGGLLFRRDDGSGENGAAWRGGGVLLSAAGAA